MTPLPGAHVFTPGKFTGACTVVLARYPCSWPEDHPIHRTETVQEASRRVTETGRRFGKTAAQAELIGLGFDGAFIGPLVTVQMIGGSPCYTVSGTPTAWYENWMRA